MNIYPKLIIGTKLVQRELQNNSEHQRVYQCGDLETVRKVVSDLYYLGNYPEEIVLYIRFPSRRIFDTLLKFMEETPLKLVILLPYDSTTATIVSRAAIFLKEDDVIFRDYLDTVRVSDSMKRKLFELFGRAWSDERFDQREE